MLKKAFIGVLFVVLLSPLLLSLNVEATTDWCEIGVPYRAVDGLTVTLHSFVIVEKTGSYQYIIEYTLENKNPDEKILEGAFKLYYRDTTGGLPQYGFFDYLFPGDSITRSYTFEELKSKPFDVLEYHHDNFFSDEPLEDSLKWKVIYPDDTPPVTEHDYDGSWRNADFIIMLTATDNINGIAETYYQINDGPVKAVGADGQPLITTEGANNTLKYWSVDDAGNEELPHKILTGIKLDKTVPTIGTPSRMPEGDVEPYQEVRILVNVTDLESGIKNVTLSCLNIDKPVSNFSIVKDLNITLCLHRPTYYYKDAVSGDVTITYPNGTAFIGKFSIYVKAQFGGYGMSTYPGYNIDGFTKFYLSPPLFLYGPGNYTIGIDSLYTADGYIIENRWAVFPSVQIEAKDDSIIWIDLPMTFNSTTGLYEATIPGQGEDILVRYKITAYDNAGNFKVEDNNGTYYAYTVIPEFPSTMLLPLLMLTTLIATILLKKKRKTKTQPP